MLVCAINFDRKLFWQREQKIELNEEPIKKWDVAERKVI